MDRNAPLNGEKKRKYEKWNSRLIYLFTFSVDTDDEDNQE